VSLTPALLPPPLAVRLISTLERELFTPLGLRETPSSSTVTTAWIGPFITATLRVYRRSPGAQAKVRGWIETLRAELDRGTMTHAPSTFPAPRHGDAAAKPRGGVAAPAEWPQPISTLAAAELLRVWIEEVDRAEEPVTTL
jgi:hypothetical protein